MLVTRTRRVSFCICRQALTQCIAQAAAQGAKCCSGKFVDVLTLAETGQTNKRCGCGSVSLLHKNCRNGPYLTSEDAFDNCIRELTPFRKKNATV